MKISYTNKILILLILFTSFFQTLQAQVNVIVTIDSGSSTTTCTDGAFGGNPEPHWQVEIAGQGNTTYPSAGICFTDTPNQQYNESWNCPTSPSTLQVCVRAFEDDGTVCIVDRQCLVSNCQNFNVPTPGNSANYSLSVGGSSTATINFTISTSGSYTGLGNDLICDAIDLGTLPPSGILGNAGLSNYNNFCAGNAGDPNPWGNDQGVWFSFTTSNTPSATIQIDGYNDPQGIGDLIDMQLALYESSNNSCNGTLTLIEEEFDPIIYSESMQVECLLPNTTYYLLVDGDDNIANLFNGQEGYFGLTIVDDGVAQSGDMICDAENLGVVPAGGSISTPPLSQTNICAGDANDPEPGAWGSDQGVWFQFFAPPSGHVTVEAVSDLIFPLGNDAIDLQLAVYGTINGTCTGSLQQQESDYDPGLFDEDLEVRCLVPGDPYWVFVDGSGLNVDGIFDITINDGGDYPAPNDSICQAIFLGAPTIANPITLNNQSNWCANNIQEPIPTNWANEAGVWFTFIAPPSGVVEFDVTSDGGLLNDLAIDIQLAVYDSDDMTCSGNLTEIESEYQGAGVLFDEEMTVECLIPGRTYYLLLDGEPGLVDPQYLFGEFDINLIEIDRPTPLGNDFPCDAIALGDPTGTSISTGSSAPHSQNNWCATNTGEPSSTVISNPDQTVWYTFIAPSTGNLTVDINQTGTALFDEEAINTEVTLFSSSDGTCSGTFSEIETDASLIDLVVYDSDITIECLNPGETYWLMIDGEFFVEDNDIDGNFDISLTEDPPQPPTPNDEICMAIALGDPFTSGPISLNNQNNLCAGDIGDPDPDAFDTDQTVWYTFTTPATGGPYAVEITATSDFPFFTDAVDLQLAVFSSSNNACNGSLTEIASDYDAIDFPPLNETIEVQCLEPGMTYYLMVDGSFINVQGNFGLDISSITANPIAQNDLICDAIGLGSVPISGSINNGTDYYNFCADVEPGEPNPGAFGTDQTVWFTFTAPNYPGPNGTTDITISLESDPNNIGNEIDLQIAVYESSDGTCNGIFSEVASDYDAISIPLNNEEIEITCLDAGETYWIQIDGSGTNTEGYFTIEITDDGGGTRPTNDNICDAVDLGPVPANGTINDGITYTNICSTVEPGEPDPTEFNIDNTVWFSFEAPASGNATIDLNNQGGIDLQVAVYVSSDGTCAGALVEHASDYDGAGIAFNEDLELECLVAGQTYWVQVDGEDNGNVIGGGEGDFTISIDDDGGSTVFPYNDTICNAFDFGLINAVTQTLTMETNVCANIQPGEPGVGSYAQQTVWYEFIAPASGMAEIDLSANSLLGIDTEIYLYSSSDNTCTGSFDEIDSDYDATQVLDEEIISTCLVPGNTYWLQIDGTTVLGPDGEFTISIVDPEPNYGTGLPGDPEPTNNDCSDAISLIVEDESCIQAGGSWLQENYGSPTPNYNPTNCSVQNCGDTWYQFEIPATGLALVEGNGTAVGGVLGDYSDMTFIVYSGSCGNLNEIECDEQDALDPNDFISMEIAGTPGEIIFIQVINEDGEDDNENFEICVSEACGSDDCLNAIAMTPNVPYCWEVAGAEGENVTGGEPGYLECSNSSDPDASVYFTFTSDCNGSSITLSIIDAEVGGTCILGTTPTDGFNISLFEDSTPCDGNPESLVDCQNWDTCDGNPVNWQQTYTNLTPNTEYILQIDGFGQFLGSGGDANGTVMITTSGNPVVEAEDLTPATCAGISDGSAIATASYGVMPYTFVWDNGVTNDLVTNLDAGIHIVTVYDAAGCEDTTSVIITEPVPIMVTTMEISAAICYNSSDGSASTTATGGTPAYSFDWDNGETTAIATGLSGGTHIVSVTDVSGCVVTADVIINAPPIVMATVTADASALCNGASNGVATAAGSGDPTTYTYDWDNGTTTATATNLNAGTHIITVTDQIGCSNTFDVLIIEPDVLTALTNLINGAACNGDSSGSATVTVTGGTINYTYNWDNGESNSTATNLNAGIHSVLITDMNGCIATANINIPEPDALNLDISLVNNASCKGISDGAASVSVTGGTPNYTYLWDNNETTAIATGLNAGTHVITVTDANNCVETSMIIIAEPNQLVAFAIEDIPVSCFGNSDGSATATATGGTAPYTLEWDNSETMATATNLSAGTHIITVSDVNGCNTTTSVNITQPTILTATAIQDTEVLCNGESNGSATVSATGGTINYTYQWDNNETTSTATGLDAGDHTVSVTDANSCLSTALVSITEPLMPILLMANQDSEVLCNGEANGSATATVSGGTPNYNFEWDNGELTATATGLNAGTHIVTVTDDNGCTETTSVVINEPTILTAAASLNNDVNCNGEANGSATATASGGTTAYSFEWDNNETTATATGLNAGAHTVSVTDANGCSITASILINEPSLLTVIASQNNPVLCNGQANGSATATVSGGTPNYNFEWDNGELTAIATGLNAGTHIVTVTDDNGCTETTSVVINEPTILTAAASLNNDVNCNGEANGSATATASGGTPNYNFEWDNGELTAIATGLNAGTHIVTVTDDNGCTETTSVVINEPTILTAAASLNNDVNCNGEANGSATATASGGTTAYTFEWDNNETTATATGLNAGAHTVSVTDANGCSITASILINEPSLLTVIASQNNPVLCNGQANGSATATASGGTPNYNFEWDNGELTAIATGLNAGTHIVTVTDDNGCTETTSVVINEPTILTAAASLNNDVNCNGEANGSATATASGGTPNYNFEWDNGELTAIATGLNAGTHIVTVTDDNGCTETTSVVINEPTILTAAASLNNDVNCNGEANGSATATASGGTPNYNFEWDNGELTAIATGLNAGTHIVTVTDDNGCTETTSVVINEPTILTAAASLNNDVNCNGEANGSATATASGGTTAYSFEWDNNETTATATGLNAGAHTVSVTDANGCSITASILINEPSLLTVIASQNNPVLCNGEANGSATATASGGTPNYNFEWDNGELTAIATGLNIGTHIVTVTDDNGCTETTSVVINEPTILTAAASLNNDVNCNGEANGSATATASGGTPNYNFEWDNGELTATATGLNAGTHVVTVTDDNGCTETTSVVINEPTILTAAASLNNDVNCNGEANGSATAIASGGTTVYTFEWDNNETTATATGLNAGAHTVSVTDANGCSITASILINQPSLLTVITSQNNPVLCNGEANGSATATVSGGTPNYNFEWDNGELTAIATGLNAGTHIVTVTDDNGCTETTSVVINEPTILTAAASLNNDVNCTGEANGSATATASGGTTAYTFEWDNNETTATATGLNAGAHTVSVTDANGCSITASILINEPSLLTVIASQNNPVLCNGQANGSATATVSGGTPNYNFEWDNGELTAIATGLNAGTHIVTVTDDNGCTETTSVVINEPTILTAAATLIDGISCIDSSDGSANVLPSGGTPSYAYIWDNLESTATATSLSGGIHFVTVIDDNGCSTTSSVNIPVPQDILLSSTINSNVSCNGESNGSATISASGGTPGYNFEWDNGEFGNIANNLDEGMHFATVTDNEGCTQTINVLITEPNPLVSTTILQSSTLCVGSSDGSATAGVSGGTPNYTYLWDNAETSATAVLLSTGLHSVSIFDANGCITTSTINIPEPSGLSLVLDATTVANCVACDGTASVSISGGNPPYTYLWSNGETIEDAVMLCSGINTVSITDVNDCLATINVTIGNTSTFGINSLTEINSISCNALCDGALAVIPTGGNPPYTYQWDDPAMQITSSATGLCAGNYSVTILDQDGCIAVGNILLPEPPLLAIAASQGQSVSCFGGSDGEAIASISGGTMPYTYLWSNNSTSANNTGLTAGGYQITVTDQNGCTITDNVLITQPVDLPIIAINNITSSGCLVCSGSATAVLGGGTAPYQIEWSNGSTVVNPSNLCAGINTLTVTDANGCSATQMANIMNSTTLSASINQDNVISCNSICDGQATAVVTGGVMPYTFLWDDANNQTTPTATNLCAANYTLTVTGADGCIAIATISITEPNSLIASSILTSTISCNGASDGSSTISVSGGTTPYTYLWDNNETTAIATSLNAGLHNATVSDNNGCLALINITLTEPAQLAVIIDGSTNANCTSCDGTASITVSGGTLPYQYSWSTGATDENPINLCSGNNSVTITDANNCLFTQSVVIGNTSTLVINAINEDASIACNGDCNAVLIATASAGNPPYTYQWNDPAMQTSATVTGLCAGNYSVSIVDSDGCLTSGNYNIIEPSLLTSISIVDQHVNCTGNSDGQATASASGGVAPYNYTWDNGELGSTATFLNAGIHTLTITDQNGCSTTNSVSITEPTSLPLVSINNITAAGCSVCDGSAISIPTGGTTPYMFNWSNGSTIANPLDLCPGVSTLIVTDANGCIATVSATIPSNTTLGISVTINNSIACNGICEGEASVTTTGGVSPYTYLWNDPLSQTGSSATGLCAGSYNVTVTGADGCFTIGSIILSEPMLLSGNAATISNVSCPGMSDGSASTIVSGGTVPYTYNWDNGETTSTAVQLNVGNHSVTITDSNNCTSTSAVTITEPSPLSLMIDNTTPANCTACDGTVGITITGGTTPYSYTWNNGSIIEDPIDLCAGTNNVTVTDANGCTITQSITIGNISTLSINSIQETNSISCNGICDGQATVTATMGNPPYTYYWNDPGNQNTATASNLCAGNYAVTISDSDGCIAINNISIAEPLPLIIGVQELAGVSCVGISDGQALSTVSGGTIPYTYLWDNGLTTSTAIGLSEGVHTVSVLDANGCSDVSNVTISNATPVTIGSIITMNTSCSTNCDGSAMTNVTSGVSPFAYQWDDPGTQSTMTATGLCAGIYQVTVTDTNGCVTIGTATIGAPTALSLNLTVSTNYNGEDISCNGASDGGISTTINGGTQPYTYSWDSGNTSTNLTGLPAGSYAVTVTDANGCTTDNSITLGEPVLLESTISIVEAISCAGGSDGTLQVTVQGGTSPFAYNWSTSDNTSIASGLGTGSYSVTTTDSNNCMTISSITLTEPLSILLSIAGNDASCSGICDGTATASVSGGSGTYNYQWSNGENSSTIDNLCAGNYDLTVTDSNNCIQQQSIVILEPNPIGIVIDSIQDVTCNNTNGGFVSTDVSGGTAPYNYSWNNGSTTNSISNVPAGNYTVTVTDASGCLAIANTIVSQPTMVFGQVSTISPTCFGDFNGLISVDTAYGGVGPYQFSLDGSSYQMDTIFGGLEAGTYSVYIQDVNDCEFVLNNILVSNPDQLEVEVGDIIELQLGDSIQLEAVVNTTDSLSFTWTPIEGLTCEFCPDPVAQPFETITYMVNVVNEDGCQASDEVLITVDKTRNVYIPNAFTPNEDGINDAFTVFTGGGVSQIKLMLIYDRWGELLFENENFQPNDLTEGWNGLFKNKKLNPAVFVYYIEVDFVDGITIPYKGDVTLIK